MIIKNGTFLCFSFVRLHNLDSTFLLPVKLHLYLFFIFFAALSICVIGRKVQNIDNIDVET